MKKYYDILSKVDLFNEIECGDFFMMLTCLSATVAEYKPGEYVITAGDEVTHMGIVLEGGLHISTLDADGARTIIAPLVPGEFFAEALCCAGVAHSPVSVSADTPATVMLLKCGRILQTCPNSCTFHTKLIENMLGIIARKNLALQSRLEILSKKSIRARLLMYLQSMSKIHGRDFAIPFNREELSDFLCVDRSALSRELGNLKSEGVIDFYKNHFKLKP